MNEFAVSAANLGSGMANAAATMALSGNDFNHSVAILTGAGEILGDNKMEEVGSGIRTLTLRLQNQLGSLQAINEEYEDLESVSKTQTQIYNLTKGTVNIMDSADPTKFKDTYTILSEVANVFDKLKDTEKSELVQIMFGKQRANIGSSVIKAFQSGQIQKAYEAAQNSAGSAMAEQEKWSNSIEAKLNKVASSFEYLSSLLVNSEGLKTALDLISGLMDGITSLVKNIGAGKLAIGTLFTALISHSMGLSKAFTFNGSSLMAFGKQFNIFNKNLMQTDQIMKYSLGTFNDTSDSITRYNQSTADAIKYQQQMRDTNPTSYTQAYLQSLNGAKGSMQGYINFLADTTYKLQGASGAIDVYKSLATQGTTAQQDFARALASSNPQLANYLLGLKGAEANLIKFNLSAAATKVKIMALNAVLSISKIAFSTLAGVVAGLALKALTNFVNASKIAIQQANELSETFKQQREDLSSLKQEYVSIIESTDDEATKNEKLKNIKKQLVEQYGFEADKIKEINSQRKDSTKLIDDEIEKQRLLEIAQNKAAMKEALIYIKGESDGQKLVGAKSPIMYEGVDASESKELDKLDKKYQDMFYKYKAYTRYNYQIRFTDNLQNDINNLDELSVAITELISKGEVESDSWLADIRDKVSHNTKWLRDKYGEQFDFYKNQVQIIADEALYAYQKSNKSFEEVYNTQGYEQWYNNLMEGLRKYSDGDSVLLNSLKDTINNTLDSIVLVGSEIEETITPLTEALQLLRQTESAFSDITIKTNEASEALQNLNQTIDDNKNPEKFFSADEIIKLLDTYPELSNAILQTAYGYKIEQSALDNLKKAKLDEHKIALQTQLNESKSALASAKLKLSAYAQEIKGIQTVAQAKAKLAEMEIKYNNILAQTSSMQKNSFVSRLTGINGFVNVVTGGYNAQKSDLENYIQAMQNVDDYQGTIDKLQTQINVLGTSFEDIKNDTSDTNDNLDKQKDIVQEMQDDMKDAQEKINDLVDLTVDMLKKQKELEKDNLKEQLDGFKKIIDKRKELIDLEKEQHDFENDIAEKNKSVSEIQQKIDNLSLDDSLEGNKKRSELNKQLADEKKKLDDFLYENEVDKRKQALDTEEELYEEKIDNQTKMIEEYLSKDAILRQDAINLINSQSQQFYNDLYNYTQTYTEMSEYEFNKLWNSAYNALRSYGNGQIDVLNILAYLDGRLVATEYQLKQIDVQVNAIKNSADSASASLGSMADVAVQKLSNVNQTLASFRDKMSGEIETYNNNKSWSLAVRPDLEYLSKLPKYHTGGLVGGTSQGSEILAKLLTGEVVSTQSQAENFVSKTLPNLFQGAIKLNNNVQQSPNVSININVEGNADDTTINKLKSTIQNVVKDTFSEINGSKRRFGGTPNAIGY